NPRCLPDRPPMSFRRQARDLGSVDRRSGARVDLQSSPLVTASRARRSGLGTALRAPLSLLLTAPHAPLSGPGTAEQAPTAPRPGGSSGLAVAHRGGEPRAPIRALRAAP